MVGTDVKSFVISHVPDGSVVEKWDALKEQWVDVSTMPKSSNPQELMRLLSNRYIKDGDTIQWRPKAGAGAAAQQAFQMIGWDDGSELPGVSAEAPSVVRNLAVAPTGVGELTLSWDPPATGDATSYTITMTTATGSGNPHHGPGRVDLGGEHRFEDRSADRERPRCLDGAGTDWRRQGPLEPHHWPRRVNLGGEPPQQHRPANRERQRCLDGAGSD
ncbi:MAG: hypothetical protein EBZ13_08465 [Planctomycetia bacterium]|nr:hypothetical protein [Planctomycetia bacterium]